MRIGLSSILVLALVLLATKLATAPLNEVYSADECRLAYARAHTRDDIARVDLHPYAGPADGGRHRCGEVRPSIVAGNPANIAALLQIR